MSARLKRIPIIAFVVGVLAVGVPYMLVSFGTVNLPEALSKPGLLVMAVAAAVAVGCGATTFWKGLALFTACVPTAIMLRVLVDVIGDPTSHNLWPFELVIGGGYAMPYVLGGTVFGWIAFKILSLTGVIQR